MHGCRDLITLSTTPSNQNINDDQQSKQDFIGSSGGGGGRDSSVPSSTPRPSLQEHKLCIREINKDNPLQVLRATISNG